MEKLTVIIPVRDRHELITRCLDSVRAQSLRPLRVIVVDNGSSDGTPQAVTAWAEHNLGGHCANYASDGFSLDLLHEEKPGASAARNRGLREVVTEFVLFFDSDDTMHPDLCRRAIDAIGSADIVIWKAETIGVEGCRGIKPFHTGDLVRRQFYNGMLATQTYMARTEFIRRIGGWNEDAAVWNDYELGIRIALEVPKVAYLPEVLVTIHEQRASITGTRFCDRTGDREHTLDIIERRVSGEPQSRRLLDMTDYRRAILAACYRREAQQLPADSPLKESAERAADMLMKKALKREGRSWTRRMLLRLLHHYTRHGGRAAYYLWRR